MNSSSTIHVPADPSLSTANAESKRIRALGWVLIVVGPCLSAAMALAARSLYGTAALDQFTGRSPRWHGSPEFTRMALELFGAVFLLGIAVLLGGVYQVRNSRRSRALIVLTLGLAGVTAYLVLSIITSR